MQVHTAWTVQNDNVRRLVGGVWLLDEGTSASALQAGAASGKYRRADDFFEAFPTYEWWIVPDRLPVEVHALTVFDGGVRYQSGFARTLFSLVPQTGHGLDQLLYKTATQTLFKSRAVALRTVRRLLESPPIVLPTDDMAARLDTVLQAVRQAESICSDRQALLVAQPSTTWTNEEFAVRMRRLREGSL